MTTVPKTNLLFLTWAENTINSGIFKNLVLEQLKSIASETELEVEILCGIPAINRSSILASSVWKRQKKVFLSMCRTQGLRTSFRHIMIPGRFFRSKLIELPFIYAGHVGFLARHLDKREIDVILCRSYHATVIALLANRRRTKKSRVVFDPRSTFPEELVLTGRASRWSLSYIVWKRIERALLRKTDTTVAVSSGLAEHFKRIAPRAQIETIHASIEVNRFNSDCSTAFQDRQPAEYTLAYLGAIGRQSFHSVNCLAKVYLKYRSLVPKKTKLLIITLADPEPIIRSLKIQGISTDEIQIERADSIEETNRLIRSSTHAVVPFKKCRSFSDRVLATTMIGSKVPEYLAAGKPVIFNSEISSLKTLFSESSAGIGFDSCLDGIVFDRPIPVQDDELKTVARQSRDIALSHFDINTSSNRYIRVVRGHPCDPVHQ